MTDLGDLLELLHGAANRWQTVRLVVRRWADSEASGRAMVRAAEQRRKQGMTSVVSSRSHGGPPTWEATTRAWLDRPGDRSRVETEGSHGPTLTVRVGPTWWSYNPHSGSVSNETAPDVGGGGGGEVEPLLDPSPLLAAVDFTLTGQSECAGRPAVEAVAVPRPFDPRFHMGSSLVAMGADEVLLAVDQERGVVLRSEARLDGRPFAVSEVLHVAFDEALADELFVFTSPDGSPVRSPLDAFARPEPVSIEEAATRASFTVLVPARLPLDWTLDVTYHSATDRPPRPDSVLMRVNGGPGSGPRLTIQQGTVRVLDNLDWEEVVRDGRRILVSHQGGASGTGAAKVEVEGTHVRVSGNIDREPLLDIVASLTPAPRELPPMVDR